MSIAENILSNRKLFSKINIKGDELPIDVSKYGDFTGGELKQVFANFLQKTFFKTKIEPGNMLITDGCGPAIDMLSFLLLDVDDIVLIPQPLNVDFERSKSKVVGVDFDDKLTHFNEEYEKHGKKVKVVFLVNPINPTGGLYTYDQLESIMKWCDERNIHLVSDEIYALSVFKKDTFVSASSFYGNISEKFDSMLHILWGVSKDFGISGFRTGLLHTKNQQLIRNAIPIFLSYCSSSLVRHVLTNIFSDEKFVIDYVESNRKLLYNQYLILEEFLIKNKIEFIPSKSGFFVWINLKKYAEYFKEDEETFWERLLDETKVNICCGKYFYPKFISKNECWYRICFPCVDENVLKIALKRIENFLNQIKF